MGVYSVFQFDSVLGTVSVISTPGGVSRVIVGREVFKGYLSALGGAKLIRGGEAERSAMEIRLYLEGKIRGFRSRLDLSSGTPFQISVWKELLKIPYGEVRTYGEIAKGIGNPKAARAVGRAVGANPIPIIIPCHRVVATDGLGGYSCGIEIKKALLRREGVIQ